MRGKGLLHHTLPVLTALVIFAVAASPPGHHEELPPGNEPGHCHSDQSVLCRAGGPAPQGDCAVCVSKRLLSAAVTDRPEGVNGPPPNGRNIAGASLELPIGGRFSFSVRGPPLS